MEKKEEKILVYLILMNADAPDKNKCPLGGEKKSLSHTDVRRK